MDKYITILCYESGSGPAFCRTEVFKAPDYTEACEKGERMLDNNFPTEVRNGYNNWTFNLTKLNQEKVVEA